MAPNLTSQSRDCRAGLVTISIPALKIDKKPLAENERVSDVIETAPATEAGAPLGQIEVKITPEIAKRLPYYENQNRDDSEAISPLLAKPEENSSPPEDETAAETEAPSQEHFPLSTFIQAPAEETQVEPLTDSRLLVENEQATENIERIDNRNPLEQLEEIVTNHIDTASPSSLPPSCDCEPPHDDLDTTSPLLLEANKENSCLAQSKVDGTQKRELFPLSKFLLTPTKLEEEQADHPLSQDDPLLAAFAANSNKHNPTPLPPPEYPLSLFLFHKHSPIFKPSATSTISSKRELSHQPSKLASLSKEKRTEQSQAPPCIPSEQANEVKKDFEEPASLKQTTQGSSESITELPTHPDAPHSVLLQDTQIFRKRIFAGLIDMGLSLGILFLLLNWLPWFVAIVPSLVYFLGKDSFGLLRGQSLGKRCFGLLAVDSTNKSLRGNYLLGLKRNLSLLVAPIEFAVLYAREDEPTIGRRLGDDWAKTSIITKPSPPSNRSKFLP